MAEFMFQFKAGLTFWAETEDAAREECEEMCAALNKNPDGPRVWVEDAPAEIVDELAS